MRLVAISVLFSLSLSAQNSTCIPLLTQGIGVVQDMSNDIHELVYATIPEAMKTIQKFTNQLSDTTNVIDSKTSYGSFAAAGGIIAACAVSVVIAAIVAWRYGGEKISNKFNSWTDQKIGEAIKKHLEAQAAAAPITVQVQ